MPFAYITTPESCQEKEFDSFEDAVNSVNKLLAKVPSVEQTSVAITIVSKQLNEKEQAMLVLAIL